MFDSLGLFRYFDKIPDGKKRETELGSCVVVDIPTSPGERDVRLCLPAVFKLSSVFMGGWEKVHAS